MSASDTVHVEHDGQRLDRFLAEQFPEYSRSYLQALIGDEKVLVDGRPARKSHTLKAGNTVRVEWPPEEPLTLPAEEIDLPILYEDDQILVINKPAGMVVHPGGQTHSGTVVNALLNYDYDQFEPMIDARRRPGIVHRLDKDTTGVLIVARTPTAKTALGHAFADRAVDKTYLALTNGRLPRKQLRLKTRIGRHPQQRRRMAVLKKGGKSARSQFTELDWTKGVSAVAARIETGRTHQIRVHLQHLGCPVVGDAMYGASHPLATADRQLLHAWSLTVPHPSTGKPRQFIAPLPNDLKQVAEERGLDLPSQPPT